MKFNRLLVIERAEDKITSGGNKQVVWKCKCECGKIAYVISGDLRSGHTKSCGCYNIEKITERMSNRRRGYNTYDLTGEYGIGYTSKGEQFYFDLEDYILIKDYCWYIHHSNYVYAKVRYTSTHIALHKLITGNIEENIVDHKNGKKFDCRKFNLRITSQSNNNKNKAMRSDNTSGYIGVHWHSRDCVWVAVIGVDYKKICLGRFRLLKDAIIARRKAEEQYYGEWSLNNSRNVNKGEL